MMISLLRTFYEKVAICSPEKRFIKYNINKHSKIKNPKFYRSNMVLIDCFYHPPFIIFWSHLVIFLIKNFNFKVSFFYFYLFDDIITKLKLNIHKLKKIYLSFGVNEGLNEFNFDYSKKEISTARVKFSSIKTKKLLEKYIYKKIKIGDLIYDTYLRTKLTATINLNDEYLFKLFLRAHKITDALLKYFSTNKIKLVIPSHTYYIQYGIITRLAISKKIPVLMIHNKDKGNKDFKLKFLDNTLPTEHNDGYLNYSKIFKSLKNKNKCLKKGKLELLNRLSGKTKLSYLKKSPYDLKKIKNTIISNKKKNIIIFCHDFFDAPHRFRKMIFSDFYEQIIFLVELSKKFDQYNWIIKPHPNQMKNNDEIFKDLEKKNPHIFFLNKEINNYEIVKSDPKFIITNHGTIAHEFAFFGVPVINTGDNPHINYNFNLHPENLNELKKMIAEIDYYKDKINFDKKKIYEFIYMHYIYNQNSKIKFLIDDSFFSVKHNNINTKPILFDFIKRSKNKDEEIELYLKKFFFINKKKISFF